MQKETQGRNVAAAAVAGGILLAVISLTAQAGGETFTATATVKSPTASASAPITFRIERFVTETDRGRIAGIIKGNDQAATRAALAAMPDIGYIEMGTRRTPIKYAYARSTGAGRLITLLTAQPVLHLGGSLPDAKPKEGFDLALALLVLDAKGTGDGELAPAARIRMNDTGGLVTDEYGSEVVRLTGIAKVQPSSDN